MNRREWIKRTEVSTRDREPADLEVSRKRYEDLPAAEKLALVREIVDVRSAELCRAYRSVVNVAFGYKVRRFKRTHRKESGEIEVREFRRLVRTPCVIFVVKLKWQAPNEQPDETLPTHLFAYRTIGGNRVRCAVPTDVDDASMHSGFKPDSGGSEVRISANGLSDFGTVACGLRRSGFPGIDFALSCRHVFSLTTQLHPVEVPGASVALEAPNAEILGETLNVTGHLDDSDPMCLDAQIAVVRDARTLSRALGDLRIDGVASGEHEVPDRLVVVTANRRIKATLRGFVTDAVDYGRDEARHIRHELLILSHVNDATAGGNSGAALVSDDGRNLLVGMHIAGNSAERLSLAVPAWHLLDPVRYGESATETWTVFNP